MTVLSRICTLRMVTGRQFVSNSRAVILSKSLSTEAVPLPDPKHKVYSEKIENIVDQIGALSLMEVSDLNALLKVILSYYSTCAILISVILSLLS